MDSNQVYNINVVPLNCLCPCMWSQNCIICSNCCLFDSAAVPSGFLSNCWNGASLSVTLIVYAMVQDLSSDENVSWRGGSSISIISGCWQNRVIHTQKLCTSERGMDMDFLISCILRILPSYRICAEITLECRETVNTLVENKYVHITSP